MTTALRTVICSLVSSSPPDTQIYVLDLLGRELDAVGALPLVGAVIGGHEEERRERLVGRLSAEIALRRESAATAGAPRIIVVIDGWSMLRSPGGDIAMLALGDALTRLIVEGSAVGLRFVVGTDRVTSLSSAIGPSIATRLVLCPADAAEAASSGVRFSSSAVAIAGRAVIAGRSGVEVQLWHTTERDVIDLAASLPRATPAPPIGVLADRVTLDEVIAATTDIAAPAGDDQSAWTLPIGIGGASLATLRVSIRVGEPFLVCGPPRSGRTTTLRTFAAAVALRDSDTVVLWFRRGDSAQRFVSEVFEICREGHSVLVLIDDVDRIDDAAGHLAGLLAAEHPALRIALAGRADILRTTYGHWSAISRRSRHGIALRPNPEVDGDLWQTPLPRRLNVRGGSGRGVLVHDGAFETVQIAFSAEPNEQPDRCAVAVPSGADHPDLTTR